MPGKQSFASKAEACRREARSARLGPGPLPSLAVVRRTAFCHRRNSLAGETAVEHSQRGPQPPGGHPCPVDELDILCRAQAIELLGKLFCLPANIPRSE